MAEYYPLLSRAISSLPNSTPESRKLVYERARKALIGQLRTHQPPVADADIDRESTALDRAIDQLETELNARAVAGPAPVPAAPRVSAPPVAPVPAAPAPGGARLPAPPPRITAPARPGIRKPDASPAAPPPSALQAPPTPGPASIAKTGNGSAPLAPPPPPRVDPAFSASRTANSPAPAPQFRGTANSPTSDPAPPPVAAPELPAPGIQGSEIPGPAISGPTVPVLERTGAASGPEQWRTAPEKSVLPAGDVEAVPRIQDEPAARDSRPDDPVPFKKQRLEAQRPVAPLAPRPSGPKRPLWIIPVGIGIVVLLVAIAAYKLRDRPEALIHAKTADPASDASKIVQRVGGPDKRPAGTTDSDKTASTAGGQQTAQDQAQQNQQQSNPPVAVAGRAALLVEAPDEPSKVKTYLGTVVWRLDNVNDDQNQTVGLAVRADISLPDDKLKASVVFQKNTDASLPASHTMKVRFIPESGNATGDVKTINVPQMRQEDRASGETLDGVTVPIVENSFLVGLSPGNAESANLQSLNANQWIDIPMTLSNGKLAKLTFEKTEAGQRDLQEAITAWSKQ